jgi:glycosyltransferase involved in cell wall biosynthesis
VLEAVERGACRMADCVVTATDAFRRCLIERGVPEEKIRVVHNSPDPEVFDRRRVRPLLRQEKEFRIVHHGTLMHRYGEDLLLEAFGLLVERVPMARLHVYGEGDLLPRLRGMAAIEPLRGKVFLHGEVKQEEIASALAAADVAVVPNRAGGIMDLAFPTKLLEAMQMGVPTVVSATRLVAQTFPEGVALVPPGDVAALAHTLYELATRPDLRRRLSEEGFRQVQRFNWEGERNKLLEMYRELGCRVE